LFGLQQSIGSGSSNSRPPSSLSQQASSGYGSTRSRKDAAEDNKTNEATKNKLKTKTNNREKKDVGFHQKLKAEDSDESSTIAVEMEQIHGSHGPVEQTQTTKENKNPLLRTKHYFSLKIPKKGAFQLKSKDTGRKFSADDTQILKESDTSTSSVSNPSTPNNKTKDLISSELSQSFASSLIPSTLTVETTQTSKLVVRNVPSSAFNISRATMTTPLDDPPSFSESSIASSNRDNVFQYGDGATQTPIIPSNQSGLPCSPTLLEQNNTNSSAEILQNILPNDSVYPRSQSALGFRNSTSLYNPRSSFMADGNPRTLVSSSANLPGDQFMGLNPAKSLSTDALQIGQPAPPPRVEKSKHTYQNLPNPTQYWDNLIIQNKKASPRDWSPLPKISEPQMVVSDIPLDPRNQTVFEVLFYSYILSSYTFYCKFHQPFEFFDSFCYLISTSASYENCSNNVFPY